MTLIQGDSSPNNLFFYDKKKTVVVLDWEYFSISEVNLLNKTFDFANFYLRCWRNKKFQEKLLREFIRRKMANQMQIQFSIIVQGLGQFQSVYLTGANGKEKGEYLKNHIRRLTESINAVF